MAAEEARIRVILDEIDSDESWHQEGSDPSDSSDDEDELDVDEAADTDGNENEGADELDVDETADTDGNENEGSDEVDEEDAVSAADTNDNVEGADDETADLVENGILTETPKLLTRKRLRQPVNWKQNVRKRLREAGEEYVDIQGRKHQEKTVGEECPINCRLKCRNNIVAIEREKIHSDFWSLSDQKKAHFYSKFVQRDFKIRERLRRQTPDESRKKFSYRYFFEVGGERIQVCKTYFLNSLNARARRISYFFDHNLSPDSGVATSPKKGRNKKKFLPQETVQQICDHINSFPRVESHYNRANTKKEFLETELSLKKMFQLYKEIHSNDHVTTESKHRDIFNTKFNIAFHKPKKDRCDYCEEMKLIPTPSEEEELKYLDHLSKKLECKEERDRDRKNHKNGIDPTVAVVSFDVKNVMALPKANVSNFFYKRKLNMYNLTGHCSLDNVTYCAVWHEMLCGRAGNHICSALLKILTEIVLRHPEIKKIILWSDSCVPQNKNSIMSYGLAHFMRLNPQIESVEQKYSEPGHGNVQEVDAIHSLIEKSLRYSEVFSPVSVLRNLRALGEKTGKLRILQMKSADFFDFQKISKFYNYDQVPYTLIKYSKIVSTNLLHIEYKRTFSDELTNVRLGRKPARGKVPRDARPTVSTISIKPVMTAEKKKDLSSMLKYMPLVDRQFFATIL